MSEMIAFCGLCCSRCPSFLATRNNDDAARKKTAALYAEKFGFNLKPEDINCDGCLSRGGRRLSYCRTCEIRKCGLEKGVENCAVCADRPCEKLSAFHSFSPEAKTAFESLQKGI